jgi:hypothetical protein
MLTQRIWTGVIGRASPSRMATMMTSAWAKLVGRMKAIALVRLS